MARNKTRWGKRRRRGGRHSVMRVNVDGKRMEEEEWWYRYGLPKKERTEKKREKNANRVEKEEEAEKSHGGFLRSFLGEKRRRGGESVMVIST